jgi:protease-4
MLGIGVQTTFVRGALDRLGIEPQLDQRYEFKNAADQVMRTEFTQAHRAALDRLAESVFTDAVDAIAQGRGLDRAAIRVDRGDLAPEVQAGVMRGQRPDDGALAGARAQRSATGEVGSRRGDNPVSSSPFPNRT